MYYCVQTYLTIIAYTSVVIKALTGGNNHNEIEVGVMVASNFNFRHCSGDKKEKIAAKDLVKERMLNEADHQHD